MAASGSTRKRGRYLSLPNGPAVLYRSRPGRGGPSRMGNSSKSLRQPASSSQSPTARSRLRGDQVTCCGSLATPSIPIPEVAGFSSGSANSWLEKEIVLEAGGEAARHLTLRQQRAGPLLLRSTAGHWHRAARDTILRSVTSYSFKPDIRNNSPQSLYEHGMHPLASRNAQGVGAPYRFGTPAP